MKLIEDEGRIVSMDSPPVDVEDTPDPDTCQDIRDELEGDHGTDLDGTPLFRTENELEDAQDEGCILIRSRDEDGSLPDTLLPGEFGGPQFAFRWVV